MGKQQVNEPMQQKYSGNKRTTEGRKTQDEIDTKEGPRVQSLRFQVRRYTYFIRLGSTTGSAQCSPIQ